MEIPKIALPGSVLGHASKYIPGPGTHIHASQIHASISGPVTTTTPPKPAKGAQPNQANPNRLPILSVSRPTTSKSASSILPEVESVVLARITRLQQRQANAQIVAICPPPLFDTLGQHIQQHSDARKPVCDVCAATPHPDVPLRAAAVLDAVSGPHPHPGYTRDGEG